MLFTLALTPAQFNLNDLCGDVMKMHLDGAEESEGQSKRADAS